MKKTILVLIALIVSVGSVYAQVARNENASTSSTTFAGKTNFTNVGVQGLDVSGNPGYIEIQGVSTKANTNYTYYLWVDETGDLRIASYATISAYSSFPNGNWQTGNMPVGTVVGGQS